MDVDMGRSTLSQENATGAETPTAFAPDQTAMNRSNNTNETTHQEPTDTTEASR